MIPFRKFMEYIPSRVQSSRNCLPGIDILTTSLFSNSFLSSDQYLSFSLSLSLSLSVASPLFPTLPLNLFLFVSYRYCRVSSHCRIIRTAGTRWVFQSFKNSAALLSSLMLFHLSSFGYTYVGIFFCAFASPSPCMHTNESRERKIEIVETNVEREDWIYRSEHSLAQRIWERYSIRRSPASSQNQKR